MSLMESPVQSIRAVDELSGYDTESEDERDFPMYVDDNCDSIAAAAPENKVGYVYCMTNLAMPGLVKIGITVDLAARRDKLFSTGVPYPFDIAFARKLENTITPLQAEKTLFRIFAPQRFYPRREFFKLGLDQVSAAFSLIGSEFDLSDLPPRAEFRFPPVPVLTAANSPRPRIPNLALIGTCQIRHVSHDMIGNYDAAIAKIIVTHGNGVVARCESLTRFANEVGCKAGAIGGCNVVGCVGSSKFSLEVRVGNGPWTSYPAAYREAKQTRTLAAAFAATAI